MVVTGVINCRRRVWTMLCCVSFFSALPLLPSICFGQTSSPPDAQRPRRVFPLEVPPDPEEVLKFDTDLVLVDVSVTDRDGQPVQSLRADDFKLYEDNAERPVSFFSAQKRVDLQQPIAVVFALDVSGSMMPDEIERLRHAVRVFAKRLSERPSLFAVMGFGMNVKLYQGLTSDLGKIDRAFDQIARDPSGLSTHAYDAVDDAVRLLVRRAPRTRQQRLIKRTVVLITDGFPVGDTVAPATVIERANDADVSVYTVTLPSYSRLFTSVKGGVAPLPTPLDVSGLAEKTGGINVYATDRDFEPLFRALAEEVSSTYVLAFYPSEEKRRDKRFHSIRIEAPRGLRVRQSRVGYQSDDR